MTPDSLKRLLVTAVSAGLLLLLPHLGVHLEAPQVIGFASLVVGYLFQSGGNAIAAKVANDPKVGALLQMGQQLQSSLAQVRAAQAAGAPPPQGKQS